MKKNLKSSIVYLLPLAFVVLIMSCMSAPVKQGKLPLKDAYKDYFLIGTALNRFQIMGRDSLSMEIVKEQFNSITPENALKWINVEPQRGKYTFRKRPENIFFNVSRK